MTKTPHYSKAAKWFQPSNEQDWLELRKNHITATASAALFGASPYMTNFDLYHRLAGTITVEVQENERILWGKRLQQAIALGLCEDNSWEIIADHPFLYAESIAHPGVGCSPDYIIRDKNNPDNGYGCLEIKNVDLFVGLDDWQDGEAPPHIEIQLQHQIGVCGFTWGAIGGLIGGNRPHVFIRKADSEVIAAIFNACDAMIERVQRNDPPPPDYLADFETIRALYRIAEPAKTIDLDFPDPKLDADHLEKLIAAKHQADIAARLAEDEKKRCSAELLDYLKDTETVYGKGWKVSATTTYRAAYVSQHKESMFRNLKVSRVKPKKEKS